MSIGPSGFGLFGHSGSPNVELDIAVELWDAQRGSWIQIGGSPFRVPVQTMLAETLNFVDAYSKVALQGARIKIWKAQGCRGSCYCWLCRADRRLICYGRLAHFAPGSYTLEVEARGYFTRRFAVFVPEYHVSNSHVTSGVVENQ